MSSAAHEAIVVEPSPLSGSVQAIPSKSVAHRALILEALSEGGNRFHHSYATISEDTRATWRCLEAFGARLDEEREGPFMLHIQRNRLPREVTLDVGESGSTLRFLLPVVAALGCGATFICHGRLGERPLSPLDRQLALHGARITKPGDGSIVLEGKLMPGTFYLPGNVSSQYVSGLLMAAPLMDGTTEIVVSEPVESRGYIDLTLDELAMFGVTVHEERGMVEGVPSVVFRVDAGSKLRSPSFVLVEGDWSNAAFWLAAGAIGPDAVTVTELDPQSRQGDRAIVEILQGFGAQVIVREEAYGHTKVTATHGQLHGCDVDVSNIPDLAAPIAAVATFAEGTTRLTGAARLRLKESDRLESIAAALNALGGHAHVENDDLVIEGVSQLRGGGVNPANDHRIFMMSAICAAYAARPTAILDEHCVDKSYPGFINDYRRLGGECHHRRLGVKYRPFD